MTLTEARATQIRFGRRMCGHMTLRGDNEAETIFHRLECKAWNCPRCGPRKAGRYKYAIRIEAERLKLCRFLTLTLDPKRLPADMDPVVYLRKSFDKLRTYLRRKCGGKISYICVLEFQKNGTPHLHCLIDRYIEWAWLRQSWMGVGGGEHVDIRLVDLHRISRYLSKYLTKDLFLSVHGKARRVTVSRGITLNPRRPQTHTWIRLKTRITELLRRHVDVARDVLLDDEDRLVSFVIPHCRSAGINVLSSAAAF